MICANRPKKKLPYAKYTKTPKICKIKLHHFITITMKRNSISLSTKNMQMHYLMSFTESNFQNKLPFLINQFFLSIILTAIFVSYYGTKIM